MYLSTKHSQGFTLIELLVVIAIIGLLSTIVLVSLNSAREKARDVKRKADIKQLEIALEMNYDQHGAYTQPEQMCSDTSYGSMGGVVVLEVPEIGMLTAI